MREEEDLVQNFPLHPIRLRSSFMSASSGLPAVLPVLGSNCMVVTFAVRLLLLTACCHVCLPLLPFASTDSSTSSGSASQVLSHHHFHLSSLLLTINDFLRIFDASIAMPCNFHTFGQPTFKQVFSKAPT